MTKQEKFAVCMEVFTSEDLLEELFAIVQDDPEVEEWLNKTWFDSQDDFPEESPLTILEERNR